jgi:hypothetical protein
MSSLVLSDVDLSAAAEHTWSVWRAWRLGQGYQLGGIAPGLPIEDQVNKRSPHLVETWLDVNQAGQLAFVQMTALVVGGLQAMNPAPPPAEEVLPDYRSLLRTAMKAIKADGSDVPILLAGLLGHCPDEHREPIEAAIASWSNNKKGAAKKGMMDVWKSVPASE